MGTYIYDGERVEAFFNLSRRDKVRGGGGKNLPKYAWRHLWTILSIFFHYLWDTPPLSLYLTMSFVE